MTRVDEAGASEHAALNGAGERGLRDGEYQIDALVQAWKRIASDESIEEAEKLPSDFLEQMDHYANGVPKKPVMRYE